MSEDTLHFGALDFALLPMFFISYCVFAVVQLANLFGHRFLNFGLLILGALALAQSFGFIASGGICDDLGSAIVCGNEGRGLVGFGMIWVWASLVAICLYLFVLGLRAITGKKGV